MKLNKNDLNAPLRGQHVNVCSRVVLGVLGVAGVLGYFCLTRSLQAILLLIEKKSRNIKYLFFELVDTTDDCGCAQGYGDHHLLSYTGS